MHPLVAALSPLGAHLLRRPTLRHIAMRAAAARRRALVVLFHRVTPDGARPSDVVPTIPTTLFRRQLETLASLGDVVPLADLLHPGANSRRVRLAVTFDDDEPSHVRYALPILRALGVPATFFLCGRALHQLGPPWWIVLEHGVAERGLAEVARSLGVDARTPMELATRCEGTPRVDTVLRTLAPPRDPPLLGRDDVRALADAGMTVGFHTLHHPPLPALADVDVGEALRAGREALAEAAGAPVDLFAYPHGRADRRVADDVRAAGYRAAWRTGGRAIAPTSDRFLLGRWEPGPLSPEELATQIGLRINAPVAAPPRPSKPASDVRAAAG